MITIVKLKDLSQEFLRKGSKKLEDVKITDLTWHQHECLMHSSFFVVTDNKKYKVLKARYKIPEFLQEQIGNIKDLDILKYV